MLYEKMLGRTKSRPTRLLNSGLFFVASAMFSASGDKLLKLSFEVEAHVYSPNRIFNWSGRPPGNSVFSADEVRIMRTLRQGVLAATLIRPGKWWYLSELADFLHTEIRIRIATNTSSWDPRFAYLRKEHGSFDKHP